MQFEIFCQFFIGYYDKNGAYVDEMGLVARKYCKSFTAFWFDIITSLPWTYLDYIALLVLMFSGEFLILSL